MDCATAYTEELANGLPYLPPERSRPGRETCPQCAATFIATNWHNPPLCPYCGRNRVGD